MAADEMSKAYPDFVLRGHEQSVNCLLFLKDDSAIDGNVLCSGSTDGQIKVWNLSSRRSIASFKGHSNSVLSVFNIPSKPHQFASSGKDGHVHLWDINRIDSTSSVPIISLRNQSTHFCNSSTEKSLHNHACPNLIVTPAADASTVLVWDIRTPSAPVVTLSTASASDGGMNKTRKTVSIIYPSLFTLSLLFINRNNR